MAFATEDKRREYRRQYYREAERAKKQFANMCSCGALIWDTSKECNPCSNRKVPHDERGRFCATV